MSDASDVSSKGSDFLGKKIGPFTAQTWIIIAGGGAIVVYMIIRKRNAGSTPLTTDSFTNPNADSISSQAGGSSSGTVNTPSGTPNTFTNAQWALNASNGLIASGDDPTTVSNALSKYMNGQSLSAAEAAIVAVAITTYGEPPQGVLPVTTGGGSDTGNGFDIIENLIDTGRAFFSQSSSGQVSHLSQQEYNTLVGQGVKPTNNYGQFVILPNGDVYGQAAYTTSASAADNFGGTTAGDWYHITADQWALFQQAGLASNPTPVASVPTNGGAGHTYTTLMGDTMANISQRFLGTSNTAKLSAANPELHDPISPGTVINIPAS